MPLCTAVCTTLTQHSICSVPRMYCTFPLRCRCACRPGPAHVCSPRTKSGTAPHSIISSCGCTMAVKRSIASYITVSSVCFSAVLATGIDATRLYFTDCLSCGLFFRDSLLCVIRTNEAIHNRRAGRKTGILSVGS